MTQEQISATLKQIYASHYLPNGTLRRRYPDLDHLPEDQYNLVRAAEYPIELNARAIADKLGMKKSSNAMACIQTCIRLGLVEAYIFDGKQYIESVDTVW